MLDALGADYVRDNPREFPSDGALSVRCGTGDDLRLLLRYKQREVELSQVKSVWDLSRARPVAGPDVRDEYRYWIAECCSRWLGECLECLDCLFLPANHDQPTVSQTPSSHNKLHQLAIAGRVGFPVPCTIVTNSPDEFLKFHGECEGNVISKTAFRLGATRGGERIRQWTSHAQRRDVARYQAIRYAPVIFQEAVAKKIELRVTVAGRKVMAAAIHSPAGFCAAPATGATIRNSTPRAIIRSGQLPCGDRAAPLDVTAALGLCYGAIDPILTPEGEYVFLEINPHGQWEFFIETATGLADDRTLALRPSAQGQGLSENEFLESAGRMPRLCSASYLVDRRETGAARATFQQFRDAHPGVRADLVIDRKPGAETVDYDDPSWRRRKGVSTVVVVVAASTTAYRLDTAQQADHWAANYVLTVNGRHTEIQSALLYLKAVLSKPVHDRKLDPMEELINGALILEAIEAAPPRLSEAEQQKAVDEYRVSLGLHSAATTRQWLAETGLT